MHVLTTGYMFWRLQALFMCLMLNKITCMSYHVMSCHHGHVMLYNEGRSKSSRKSANIFLFCKSAELNYYSYKDKHDLYLYSKFCCSGMNTMLTVVAMETVHHDYRPTFVHFCKKPMFKDDVAFVSLPCFFRQTLYEQSSIYLR